MRDKTVGPIDPRVAIMKIDLLTADACHDIWRQGHNATNRPSPLIDGVLLLPFPAVATLSLETRLVVPFAPVRRSWI